MERNAFWSYAALFSPTLLVLLAGVLATRLPVVDEGLFIVILGSIGGATLLSVFLGWRWGRRKSPPWPHLACFLFAMGLTAMNALLCFGGCVAIVAAVNR